MRRRSVDLRWMLAGLGALLLVTAPVAGAPPAPEPRNVILILSDDQGTVDAGCCGADDLATPHIDALARRGVRLRQFYAAAPVCSPSRAALLTGRYPQRAGVPGNVGLGAVGMPARQVTIAESLRAAGYRTALFGKWHLGSALPGGDGPLEQGFDEFFGHKRGCIDNYSHFFYWSGPNVHDLWRDRDEHWEDGQFFGDLIVREATRFLRESRGRPFFLYLPFNIPHYPLQGQARWRKHYRDLPEPRRSYAALVSTLDEKIGRIVSLVDDLGLRERTLIIFMSDHGHSTEVRTMSGGGSAGPYRGSKFSLFEGGIRVPAIASLPGTLPEGEVRDQLATALDWLPTITELCGVSNVGVPIDGRSLVPILLDAAAPSPHGVMHWQTGGGADPQWAVRDGDWKLVHNARDTDGKRVQRSERHFLSHLGEDATERVNRAADHPEVVRRLEALHAAWLEETRRSLPR